MSEKSIMVTKASGIADAYSAEKLRKSLAKSGAGEQIIEDILREIQSTLYNGIPTKEIYRKAFNLLKMSSRGNAGRYNLKRAIMEMGPSGFPFEKFIGALFQWQGYEVKLKQFLEGVCVTHEIDVLAENDLHILLMECKYHTRQGIFSDVKIPLYFHSRFLDILENRKKNSPGKQLQGWVVTNTKFSTDAVKYGTCTGLHLLGWNYPLLRSLSILVDESRLYPLTCLTTLSGKEKENLLEAGLILCRDLEKNEKLLLDASIALGRIPAILEETAALCSI